MAVLKLINVDTNAEYKELLQNYGVRPGAIYFVKDTGQIFLWNDTTRDYSGNIQTFSGTPPTTPEERQLYYDTTNNKLQFYTGGAWVYPVGSGSGSGGISQEELETAIEEVLEDMFGSGGVPGGGGSTGDWGVISDLPS